MLLTVIIYLLTISISFCSGYVLCGLLNFNGLQYKNKDNEDDNNNNKEEDKK